MQIPQAAIQEVLEFGNWSWQRANWEYLIAGGGGLRGILNLMQFSIPASLRDPVTAIAATELRKVYPEYTRGKNKVAIWASKTWDNSAAVRIIQIIANAAQHQLAQSSGGIAMPAPVLSPETRKQLQGLAARVWSPWQLFTARQCVAQAPGLYVFARFAAPRQDATDPLHKSVVYIGMTETQTIAQRLEQFSATWRSGMIGHSGAFTLRTILLEHGEQQAVLTSNDLYVAWQYFAPHESHLIRESEHMLLHNYVRRWSCLPLANSKT